MMDSSTARWVTFTRHLLGWYIFVLVLALVAGLIVVWPSRMLTQDMGPFFSMEGRFLLSTLLAGALGSCIHLATSFAEHTGRGALEVSWSWWYFLRPSIGGALATVVYFVMRAGLIAGTAETSAATLNPYGVAAIAALSGMFSKQATDKLREVFENLCATDQSKFDSKDQQQKQQTS